MKKNKKLLAGLAMGLALFISGCTSNVSDVVVVTKSETPETFIEIDDGGSGFHIVYHTETKVMYAVSDSGYNHGTVTVLVDADGKPLLWEE